MSPEHTSTRTTFVEFKEKKKKEIKRKTKQSRQAVNFSNYNYERDGEEAREKICILELGMEI